MSASMMGHDPDGADHHQENRAARSKARASTLPVLSGPLVIWRKKTRRNAHLRAMARTIQPNRNARTPQAPDVDKATQKRDARENQRQRARPITVGEGFR